ncbi:MAG: hypothetical protein Q9214_005602, partial [Letrouitia sp. 1 TL-2023]
DPPDHTLQTRLFRRPEEVDQDGEADDEGEDEGEGVVGFHFSPFFFVGSGFGLWQGKREEEDTVG